MLKVLLCRPQGGLNDILCQIEECARYAELSGRSLIIDTQYEHSPYANAPFSHFFRSRQRGLHLDLESFGQDLSGRSIYPKCVADRLDDYETVEKDRVDSVRTHWCERESGQPVTFDFGKDYPHEILVHHQEGGGYHAIFALTRLQLTPYVTEELIKRINSIGRRYWAVHVRNTDYQTDYSEFLAKLSSRQQAERWFVATDSAQVIADFVDTVGEESVISFAQNLSMDGSALHKRQMPAEEAKQQTREALLDLLTLALSHRLFRLRLKENRFGMEFSGFTALANQLWLAKRLLQDLINQPEIRLGLDSH
jgi:hypothetical protein